MKRVVPGFDFRLWLMAADGCCDWSLTPPPPRSLSLSLSPLRMSSTSLSMSARSPELKARKGSASATLGCLLRPPSRLRSISAHLRKYKVLSATRCFLLLTDLIKIRSDLSC